jgi:hypothetical protein
VRKKAHDFRHALFYPYVSRRLFGFDEQYHRNEQQASGAGEHAYGGKTVTQDGQLRETHNAFLADEPSDHRVDKKKRSY